MFLLLAKERFFNDQRKIFIGQGKVFYCPKKGFYCPKKGFLLSKARWTRIEVEQSEDERLRRFVFIVRVDGEEVAKAINNKPRSFSKVNIVDCQAN